MKKRVRLDRVELWASRDELPETRHILEVSDERPERDGDILVHRCGAWITSPPNARGEYPIAQPGNVVPVVLRPDWSRYRK